MAGYAIDIDNRVMQNTAPQKRIGHLASIYYLTLCVLFGFRLGLEARAFAFDAVLSRAVRGRARCWGTRWLS